MSLINDEAEFLREVIAEVLNAPVADVPIAGVAGVVSTKGIVIGGFAVHLQTEYTPDQGLWRATHIKTGGCIGPDYDTMFEALVAVGVALGSDMPWDEIDTHEAFLTLTTKDQRKAVRAKLNRIGVAVQDGEVAPEGQAVE